jgi:hypothetical protein
MTSILEDTRFLKVFLSSLAMLAVVSLQGPALAQTADGPTMERSAEMVQNFERQAIDVLDRSDDAVSPQVQTQMLKRIVVLATTHRDKMRKPRAVAEVVVDFHRQSTSESDKDLALAALQALGTPDAARYVRETKSDPIRIQQLIVSVLQEKTTVG